MKKKKKSLRDMIPNLDKLYDSLKEFIEAHQGEKGYVDCQPSRRLDSIFAIIYDDDEGRGVEHYVYALRVKEGDIEVLLESILRSHLVVYEEADFHGEETEGTRGWFSLRSSDVYYVPTIFSIAEAIEEYV